MAARLRNREAVRAARALPYQLLMAYHAAGDGVPVEVREALQDAMEIATSNVPVFDGKVYVCPDVSGSMQSPVTGARRGATTAVRCVDVAALVAAAIARKNPQAEVDDYRRLGRELRQPIPREHLQEVHPQLHRQPLTRPGGLEPRRPPGARLHVPPGNSVAHW